MYHFFIHPVHYTIPHKVVHFHSHMEFGPYSAIITILCSLLPNCRSLSHYIFIRKQNNEQNNLLHSANFLVQG